MLLILKNDVARDREGNRISQNPQAPRQRYRPRGHTLNNPLDVPDLA
jgi:hypothetical protein